MTDPKAPILKFFLNTNFSKFGSQSRIAPKLLVGATGKKEEKRDNVKEYGIIIDVTNTKQN